MLDSYRNRHPSVSAILTHINQKSKCALSVYFSTMEVDEAQKLASGAKKRSQSYPEPLIYEPSEAHNQSFIILHGRGSNAQQFGPPLLAMRLTCGKTLQEALPNAKFIFPTASFRRATLYKRIPITQWFDHSSWDENDATQGLQIEGLRETSRFIHELVAREVDRVGSRNVYLGGLSQGCAAMLVGLALWTGPPLAGAFGMCGWLPLWNVFPSSSASSETLDVSDVVFECEDEPGLDGDGEKLRPLFEELEVEYKASDALFETPIFLGHGCQDERVAVGLGERAADTLRGLGCDVQWQAYEGLGHWYHSLELQHIVDWIQLKRNF